MLVFFQDIQVLFNSGFSLLCARVVHMSTQKTDNALQTAISELKEFAFQTQGNNTETISLVCEIESLVEKLEKKANFFNFRPPTQNLVAPVTSITQVSAIQSLPAPVVAQAIVPVTT